jgi:hypothetical protein
MTALPPLPLPEWEATKNTLHLWIQIVGKVRMASSPPKNHWWHVPLYLDVHGLTTRLLHSAHRTPFEIRFDFAAHRLVVETPTEERSFDLVDGLSVADFDAQLHGALGELDVRILESPYRLPTTTPFPEDREHNSYDRDAVARFWRVLDWSADVLEEFSGWYCGKASPVHFFWHGFDLAMTRFSGRVAPPMPGADAVSQEAYTHEVISFGFWPGDPDVREPTFYSYTLPEPEGLRDVQLSPEEAFWADQGSGSLARLPYEVVRHAGDPRQMVLGFYESAYEGGADAAGWDRAALMSSWCPIPG